MWISWPWLLAGLLVICLGSFTWGMRKFFSQPAGVTAGMKIIQIFGALAALVNFAAYFAAGDIAPERAAGAALCYLLALALFWSAIRSGARASFSAAFSPDEPISLVDHGAYRLVRHPFYSSYLLTWFAGPLATLRWWLLPPLVAMLVIYARAAAAEERKFACSPLAQAYAAYRSRTGTFLPNPVKMLLARNSRRDLAKEHAAGLAQYRA